MKAQLQAVRVVVKYEPPLDIRQAHVLVHYVDAESVIKAERKRAATRKRS